MLERLIALSSLPNLHPALVHFPLALLPLAIGFDVVAVASARRWFDRVATVLYVLGAGAAFWALESGEAAAESFVDLPAAIEPRIAEHSDMAHYALWVFASLAVVRLGLVIRDRAEERLRARGLRLIALLVAFAGAYLLVVAASRGGGLVYRDGLGVAEDALLFASPAAEEVEADRGVERTVEAVESLPTDRLVSGDDGSIDWLPIAADGEALGSIVFPVAGFARGAVEAVPAQTAEAGLGLEVLDRTILVLGDSFNDVRVEVELMLDGFTGTAGVAHHVRSAEAASWFEVATGGGAALRLSQGGSILTLEEAALDVPSGTVRLAVSVAGGHRKGMLNGAVVAHGHIASSDGGRVGLLLDGTGRVIVKRLSVEPIE